MDDERTARGRRFAIDVDDAAGCSVPVAAAATAAAALLTLRLLAWRLSQHVETFLFLRQMLR